MRAVNRSRVQIYLFAACFSVLSYYRDVFQNRLVRTENKREKVGRTVQSFSRLAFLIIIIKTAIDFQLW